jgi:hypothetical protein
MLLVSEQRFHVLGSGMRNPNDARMSSDCCVYGGYRTLSIGSALQHRYKSSFGATEEGKKKGVRTQRAR